ncbi:hypothetical protein AGLY_007095 [Aphis glycines]|uniref:Uncharacterized protein n=1 Tax=Aphis glycines TaxID=307491 RepID=A0A6G0TPT5_APHGL|nr:hypothetical protein AGLY_007095 [Aphis glycines]
MVLLKSTVVVLLAVACISAATTIVDKQSQDHVEPNVDLSAESTKSLPSVSSTTLSTPIAVTSNTTLVPPTTSSSTTSSSTTSSSTTTTSTPSTTSTQKPTTTTTTTVAPTTTPNSTTLAPTTTAPTTQSPNTTTTALPPTPEPSPARSWDGPSFLGGMVLAFGIVAVGFVGYRFFYLGRGGAYHTLAI